MLGRAGRAGAFLIGAGFAAGFMLSSGSAHLMFGAAHAVAQQGGDGAEPASPEQKGGKGSKRGGFEQEGKEKQGGGGGSEGAATKARAGDKASKLEDDSGSDSVANTAAAPDAADTSAGAEALTALLVGNTLKSSPREGETVFRYISRKGWQGDQDRSGLVVRRWMARDNRICTVDGAAVATCETITITREKKPQAGTGALLGAVTFADGSRWTLLRGNPAAVPESIPLIIGEQSAQPEVTTKATSTGRGAVDAMVGRTFVHPASATGPTGIRYDTDGRWISAKPLEQGAKSGMGGVRVTIGTWRFSGDMLCLDEPGLELKRQCFVPEQWGTATFRLRSSRAAAVTTLVGVDAL